jgi:site-specific DNA recombinase
LNVALEDSERLLASISDYDRSAVIQNAIDSLNNIENESIENQNRVYRLLFECLELVNTVDEFEIRLKEKDVSN